MRMNLIKIGAVVAALFLINITNGFAQDSLDIKIGQMIMVGVGDIDRFNGDETLLIEIGQGKVGGIIYFEKNLQETNTANELRKMISTAQENATIPLLVTIDEEGGKVNRLKPKYGFPQTASAMYLGELNDLDSTAYYAQNTAGNLKDLGFNLNYAPVLDLQINEDNPVIVKLERSYSRDPLVAVRHAKKVVEVHHENQIGTVFKHFPGHGSSAGDTHYDLTDVSSTWYIDELVPYKMMIENGLVDGIMTAHIINGHLDEEKVPATLSKNIVTGVLRDFLGYDGVVFTDDMQMGAIKDHFGFENAIRMALQADVDILMFANNVNESSRKSATQIHAYIKSLVEEGLVSEEKINRSYERIRTLKAGITSP